MYFCQEDLRSNFEDTKRRFVKYKPVYDENGLIRVYGRLAEIEIDDQLKHPIILPAEHPLVRMFLVHHHKKLLHQGYRVVIANLTHSGYLIRGGKKLLNSISSRCIFCRIRRRKLFTQLMGNLPSFRIQVRKPPFTSVAVDFFWTFKNKTKSKRYSEWFCYDSYMYHYSMHLFRFMCIVRYELLSSCMETICCCEGNTSCERFL